MNSKLPPANKPRSASTQQQQLLDPFDMNGPDFNPDLFLNKVLKEQNLSNLLESEVSLYKSIGSLDSEMQTLVYENYNKFISATDTITKMSSNFKEIEDELDKLSGKISQITSSSSKISDSLKDKRTNLSKLSSTFVLLQKLDFLFQLPVKMSTFYNDKCYIDAVKCYLQSESTLKQYQHFPSISIIDQECQSLLVKLKEKLHESFTSYDQSLDSDHLDVSVQSINQISPVSSGQRSPLSTEEIPIRNLSTDNLMTTIIGLLLQLNENPDFLSFRFLKYSSKRLNSKLSQLDYYINLNEKMIAKRKKIPTKNSSDMKCETSEIIETIEDEMIPVDVLEFVDMACNGLLSQLVSIVHSFDHLFVSEGISSTSKEKYSQSVSSNSESLMKFVDKYMNEFVDRIMIRLYQESIDDADFKFLSRSLDRFHRRVISVRKVLPNHDYSSKSNQVIDKVINNLMTEFKMNLETTFNEQIMKMRQLIAATNNPGSIKDSVKNLINEFESVMFDAIHSVIKSLIPFLDPGIQFSKEGSFESSFLIKIREEIVVNFINHMLKTLESYSTSTKSSSSPTSSLILILSKISFNLDQNLISKVLSLIDDDPKLSQKIVPPKNFKQNSSNHITQVNQIKKLSKETGHKLLVHYVVLEGNNLSQMIRKSVETRDWLSSIEPRSGRPVMKRVIEDVVSIEAIVSQMYEEGFIHKSASSTGSSSRGRFSSTKKGQSGQGIKKLTTSSSGYHLLSHGNPYTSGSHLTGQSLNQSFDMINISKFLSEKIDLNLNKLETDKVSIMTAIIKIMLKSLIEVIRLSTFSRFGLQQIQVDCFYLQMFCWKYVSDETIVYNLLEDAIQSAINRCLDPLLMEMSIVESICEGVN